MTFLFDIKEEKKVDNTKIVLQLEKAAGSCFAKAESISDEVSGPWTRKRQAQADSNAKKKDRLYRWGRILTELATLWENNNIPALVSKIRTVSDLEFVLWNGGFPKPPDEDTPADGWYMKEYPARLKKALSLGLTCKEDSDNIVTLLGSYGEIQLTAEQEQAIKLKEELKKVHTYNIPGFFPTPDELIDVMLEHAEIEPFHYIFEPSAGIGSIVDRITKDRQDQPYPAQGIDCCELWPSLAYILMLKGYTVISNDFNSAIGPLNGYDRIIMNPPFEKGQDMEHVMICFYKFLKRGGRLVSVMSTSAITGSNKIHQQFKQFREDHRAYYIENGAAFKNAFNSTGTHSIILVVDKEK
jgi:hypothetical protein